MFGSLFGDIIGSYYELHCTKDYDFPFARESTFTDDSVMTCAVCRAILLNGNGTRHIRQRAKEYAVQYKQFYSYFPHAGYGNMFTEWARNPRNMRKVRSYGNGGAMRAVPIGYACETLEEVLFQAKASCLCTHNSREAIHGAQAVASAVWLAGQGETKSGIRKFISRKFRYNLDFTLKSLRPHYVFDSSTAYSVPPSIVSFLESDDYESAVRNAVSLGGDADTMACIAGGIAEAYYKSIPKHIERFCYSRLDCTLKTTAHKFCKKYGIDSFR
ncbi:MAG: ADP-ribosylglycohydrolase family protein [Ruminococcus flavefaciens]|nr:ADP-ribosylglycohydrolase family protein [Ruminococcus flavefaciens]MCM1228613.1 ADP-ribosylglycohydrolase family protein [Ruminococcus flavefaciens]